MNQSDFNITAIAETEHAVARAHALYCELTGQRLILRPHWQLAWCRLLHQGFTLEDIRCVVRHLQKEIRKEHRNLGALKLSNLLQPERFEEDLNISRVRLQPPPKPKPPINVIAPEDLIDPKSASEALQTLRRQIRSQTAHPD